MVEVDLDVNSSTWHAISNVTSLVGDAPNAFTGVEKANATTVYWEEKGERIPEQNYDTNQPFTSGGSKIPKTSYAVNASQQTEKTKKRTRINRYQSLSIAEGLSKITFQGPAAVSIAEGFPLNTRSKSDGPEICFQNL